MKRHTFIFILISITIFLVGCSSTLTVRSEPADAEVYIYNNIGNGERKLIGKTPFEVSESTIEGLTKISPSSGSSVELILEKKEHRTERVIVPAARLGTLGTEVFVRMRPGAEEGRLADLLIQHLFNAQRFASQGEFERAHIEIDKALSMDSKFVRGLSMKAAIHLLQHNHSESLKWYEKVLAIDPQFDDAVKMITRLKQMKNGDARMPASEKESGEKR